MIFPTSNITCIIIINVLLFYQTFLRTANAITRPSMDNEEDEVSMTAIVLLFYMFYKLVLQDLRRSVGSQLLKTLDNFALNIFESSNDEVTIIEEIGESVM